MAPTLQSCSRNFVQRLLLFQVELFSNIYHLADEGHDVMTLMNATRHFEHVMGAPPRTLRQWVEEHAHAFK